jgi:hypothetical protein
LLEASPLRPSTAHRLSASLETTPRLTELVTYLFTCPSDRGIKCQPLHRSVWVRRRPSDRGIKCQPLHRSAWVRRRQATMPHSDGDRSPIRQLRSLLRHPWHCGDTVGTCDALCRHARHCSRHCAVNFVYLPLRQNPRQVWARPSDAARALTRARPLPGGPSTLCHACLEDGILHSNCHDAHRSYQDASMISTRPGRHPGQLHARRLTLQCLTVYLLQ